MRRLWDRQREKSSLKLEVVGKEEDNSVQTDGHHEQTDNRMCKAGPDVFKIVMTRKQWNKFKLNHHCVASFSDR